MEQEKRTEALKALKMLLGTEDESKDDLLFFLLDDVERLVLGYCRLCCLPEALEGLIPVIAADMYRAKGYGDADFAGAVKSVSEGGRSVSFAAPTDESILANYYKRLKPYVNRRGRVPSDVGKVCECI